MEIETQRLLIRDVKPEDEIPFVKMAADGSLNDCGFDRDCGNWMKKWIDEARGFAFRDNPHTDYLAYTITLKADSAVIGSVGCSYYEDLQTTGITYFIGAQYRNNGYAAEAVKAYASYFLSHYNAAKIKNPTGMIATVRDENIPSWKVAEKAGFILSEKRMYKDLNDCEEKLYRFYEISKPKKEPEIMDSNAEGRQNHSPSGNMDTAENLAWEEISTEHIVQDEWIDFRKSAYRFPDGRVFEPYYSYSRKDYVVIVASDEEGKYLCVRQFRQGIREVTTEFPAGGIERTDGSGCRLPRDAGTLADANALGADSRPLTDANTPEDDSNGLPDAGTPGAGSHPLADAEALEAARRELLEETGYVSDNWAHLLTVPSNATMADNYAHIFMAARCRKAGEQSLDETEFLRVRKYSAEEIEALIAGGGFQQAVHIMAWLLARRTPAP